MSEQGTIKWSYYVQSTPRVRRASVQVSNDGAFIQVNQDRYYYINSEYTSTPTFYCCYKLNSTNGSLNYRLPIVETIRYGTYLNVNGNCQIDRDNNCYLVSSFWSNTGNRLERFLKILPDNTVGFNITNGESTGNLQHEATYSGQCTINQEGDVITRNSLKSRIYCRDKLTGQTKWYFDPISASYQYSSPVVIGKDGTYYYSHVQHLYQIKDPVDNNIINSQLWNYNIATDVDQCLILDGNDNIYLNTQNFKIYKFNKLGVKQWEYTLPQRIWGMQISSNDKLICSCNDGKIYQLDLDSNPLWTYDTTRQSPIKSNPQIGIDRKIYFGDDLGYFYCINDSGEFQWETYLQQQIQGPINLGPDGTQYFTQADYYVYQINTDSYGIDNIDNNYQVYRLNSQQNSRVQRSKCKIYNYYGEEQTEELVTTEVRFLRDDVSNTSPLVDNQFYIPSNEPIYSNEKCIRLKQIGMQGTSELKNFKLWQEPIGDTTGLKIKYGLTSEYTKPATTTLIQEYELPTSEPEEQNISVSGDISTPITEEEVYTDYIYLQLEISPDQSYTGSFTIKYKWND